jgi:hypothetical protein
MVEEADPCEFSRSVLHTARKAHKCSECGREIGKGERYEYATGRAEELFVNKTCAHCIDAREWLVKECGGYAFGCIQEDLTQHWYEERVHTSELGRLIVGMRRKWRNRKGQLVGMIDE